MLHPVKVFDSKGNLKKIISKEELEERFWNPESQKRVLKKGNSNSRFFTPKGHTPKDESEKELTHGTFHPEIS